MKPLSLGTINSILYTSLAYINSSLISGFPFPLLVEGTIRRIFFVDMLSLISVNIGSPAIVIIPSPGVTRSNFKYVVTVVIDG